MINKPTKYISDMKKYFETLGFKVIDIIKDDIENGVAEGFCILEKKDKIYEISYWTASGHYLRYDYNIDHNLEEININEGY